MPPVSEDRAPQQRGSAGQAGTSMQAVCRPCCAHVSPTRGCADGAASPHPGFGVTLPWACCVRPPPPEMEALTPPLCFWSCWQGRLHVLPAPPLRGHCLLPVTSSWDPSPGPQAGVPQQGGLMPWGAVGKAWGGHPPHLYLLQRETIYREIYIFKLIFKDLFLSLWPRPAAQRRQRGGTPFASAVGARSWGTDLVPAPQLHGVLGGHRHLPPLPPILAALCLSFPTSDRRRDGDRGCA